MKTILISILSILLISFLPNDSSTANEINNISNMNYISENVSTFDFEQSLKSITINDSSFRQIKNRISQAPTIYGEKWRVFMIEHRKVAQIVDGSNIFHFDELLSQNTNLYTPRGLESLK